jgi:hypothetical protein
MLYYLACCSHLCLVLISSAYLDRYLQSTGGQSLELSVSTKDGHQRLCALKVNPLTLQGHSYYIGTHRIFRVV